MQFNTNVLGSDLVSLLFSLTSTQSIPGFFYGIGANESPSACAKTVRIGRQWVSASLSLSLSLSQIHVTRPDHGLLFFQIGTNTKNC